MKDFSKQLLKLVDGLKISKFHLVGFSLGSLIARDFASLHNNRLSSLTIFGTVYKRSEDEKRQIFIFNINTLHTSISLKSQTFI